LRRVDSWMPPCLAHYPDTDVWTNTARVPFTQLPLPLHLCAPRARSLYSHAEPSPPLLSPGTARVASTQCMAIKGGHPLHLVRTSAVSAPGKPSPQRLPLFSATLSVPSHLTPPLSPCVGPRALPEPRVTPRPGGPAPSPPLSSGAIDRVSELHLSVVHPPRFDSAHGTVSGRCAEVHGCFPWTSSHRPSYRRPLLAAPRHALHAVWTSTWYVHSLCFGPCHARRCPIARGNIYAQLGRRVAVDEPPRAVPWHAL
jgi:hypothetical protein